MGWQPETQPKGKPPVEKTKEAETMQRLIDANALKEMICSHVYPVVDYFNNKDYGMFWTGGIEKAIDEQPTIDAIPIEWILNHERMPKEGKGHDAIMDMIADWRKEHAEID